VKRCGRRKRHNKVACAGVCAEEKSEIREMVGKAFWEEDHRGSPSRLRPAHGALIGKERSAERVEDHFP